MADSVVKPFKVRADAEEGYIIGLRLLDCYCGI